MAAGVHRASKILPVQLHDLSGIRSRICFWMVIFELPATYEACKHKSTECGDSVSNIANQDARSS